LWNVPFITSFPFHYKFPFTDDFDPYGEELITSSELFDLADYVNMNTNHDYKNHIMNGWSSFKAYLNSLTFTSISIWFFEEEWWHEKTDGFG
jgi:hypothetical protein